MRSVSIFFALLVCCPYAHGDTVYLKNGKTLEGESSRKDADGVVLKLPSGEIKLRRPRSRPSNANRPSNTN